VLLGETFPPEDTGGSSGRRRELFFLSSPREQYLGITKGSGLKKKKKTGIAEEFHSRNQTSPLPPLSPISPPFPASLPVFFIFFYSSSGIRDGEGAGTS